MLLKKKRRPKHTKRRVQKKEFVMPLYLSIILSVLFAAFAVASGVYMHNTLNEELGVVLHIDGEEIGFISDADDARLASDMLTENIYRDTGTLYKFKGVITYSAKPLTDSAVILNANDVYGIMNGRVQDAYQNAYQLYVDGVSAGICSSEQDILYAIEEAKKLEGSRLAQYGIENADVFSNIEIKTCLANRSAIIDGDELARLLVDDSIPSWIFTYEKDVIKAQNKLDSLYEEITGERAEAGSEGESSDADEPIAGSPDEGKSEIGYDVPPYADIADDKSEQEEKRFLDSEFSMNLEDMAVVSKKTTRTENKFLVNGSAIDVSVDYGIPSSSSSQRVSLDYDYKAQIVEAQVDSYQTVYMYDENRLQSYRVVKVKGSDGILANTYSLTYRQNHLVERKLVSSETVLERVDEVIVIGTRKQSAPGVFTNSLMWPLYYDEAPVITSYYGSYRPQFDANGYHRGLDIYLPMRSDILAAEGGIVTTVDRTPSYGIRIIIDHDGTNFQTLYAHLDQALVKKGDKVYAGQLIAKSGATGNVTGPHLHFEVRANMRYKNPMNYLPDYK